MSKSNAKMIHHENGGLFQWEVRETLDNGETVIGKGATPESARRAFSDAKIESLAMSPVGNA